MNKLVNSGLALAILVTSLPSLAQEQSTARPELLLREIVQGMPKGEKQEMRVLTASFRPGDKTVFHTHRFPGNCVHLGGCIHIGDGGPRTNHSESWPGAGGATERENDGLQPKQHRAAARSDLLRE
jgi:hypothetical protein